MRRVLITGVTGFTGRVFLRELLAAFADLEIWGLVRPVNGFDPAQRPELAEFAAEPRFHVLPGDVTVPGVVSPAPFPPPR